MAATDYEQWIWRQQTKNKHDSGKIVKNGEPRLERPIPVARYGPPPPGSIPKNHRKAQSVASGSIHHAMPPSPHHVMPSYYQSRQYHQATLPRNYMGAPQHHNRPQPQMMVVSPKSKRQYHTISAGHRPPFILQRPPPSIDSQPIQQPIYPPSPSSRYVKNPHSTHRSQNHYEKGRVVHPGRVNQPVNPRHHEAVPHVRFSLYRPKSIEGHVSPHSIREHGHGEHSVYESPHTRETRLHTKKEEITAKKSSNNQPHVIILNPPPKRHDKQTNSVAANTNFPKSKEVKNEENFAKSIPQKAQPNGKIQQNGGIHIIGNVIVDHAAEEKKTGPMFTSTPRYVDNLELPRTPTKKSDSDSGVELPYSNRQRKSSEGSIKLMPPDVTGRGDDFLLY